MGGTAISGWRGNAIGIAGASLAVSFFLSWFMGASGFDLAREGGVHWLMLAIPLLGGLSAYYGFQRAPAAGLAALGASAAVFVPLLVSALWNAGWRAHGLVAIGVVLLVAGVKNTGKELALPLGLVLVAVCGFVAFRIGALPDDIGNPDLLFGGASPMRVQLLAVLAYGLVVLAYAIAAASVWLTVTGIVRKGQRAAMIATGGLLVAGFVYATLLATYGAAAFFGSPGVWITGVSAVALLVLGVLGKSSTPATS